MLDSLLDALGYVGDSLAKPGRAVRGLLAGRPDEALAAIPFSDSLGLTDPSRAVTGHDLLQNLGMDPGDGLGGTLAGIGVDMATDPLTYAGGALARGLMGGRFGRRVANESDIFDLVSPAEREADAARAAMVDRAFPLPSQPQPTEAGGLMDNLAAEAGVPASPQPSLLSKIPSPEEYAHHIGYGPDWGFSPGIPQDMLDDGRSPLDILRATLGGWDNAMGDLERLTPDAKGALIGTADYLPGMGIDGATPGIPISEMGRQWQRAMQTRRGDLQTLIDLQQKNPSLPDDLYQAVLNQHSRIGAAGGWSPQSSASLGLNDILGGGVQPSTVPAMMDYMKHLPVDEATLRKVAANSQREQLMNQVHAIVDTLGYDGEIPIDQLPISYEHDYLLDMIRNYLDPKLAIEGGTEPGIAYNFVRHPPEGPGGDMVRQLLDVYSTLRLNPGLASKFPPIG